MEENQNTENTASQESPSFQENTGSNVSFPTVGAQRKGNGAKTLLIIGILILVAVLGFVIFKSASDKDEVIPEPTPFDNLTTPSENGTQTAAPVSTSTPKPADKSDVEIEVQNGTGITGEAAYLQTQLKALGYTNVKVGNASVQNATATVVTFAKSLAADVVSELTTKLKSLYQEVTVKTSTTATMDVVIVTGLRKGATPKPSATAAPVSTATASPTVTPTATP